MMTKNQWAPFLAQGLFLVCRPIEQTGRHTAEVRYGYRFFFHSSTDPLRFQPVFLCCVVFLFSFMVSIFFVLVCVCGAPPFWSESRTAVQAPVDGQVIKCDFFIGWYYRCIPNLNFGLFVYEPRIAIFRAYDVMPQELC